MTSLKHSSAIARVHQVVRAALLEAGVRAGDALVVACSHGPDSLVLADATLALWRALSLGDVVLCYVDHGLRAAAGVEASRVAAFAQSHGTRAVIRRVQVDRQGVGPEAAARDARYRALFEVAQETNAWILVGHTSSDQAETVLMRLLRGAGPVGLAGIPARRDRVLRPLLSISRADVLAYVESRGLTPSLDASNLSSDFLRNRVRNELLPRLRDENPSIDATLARTAHAMREVAAGLEWAVAQAESKVGLRRAPQAIDLSAPALRALPPILGKYLLAKLARELGISLSAKHLEAALEVVHRSRSGDAILKLPGLELRLCQQRLVLEVRTARTSRGIRLSVAVEYSEKTRVRFFRPGDRMRPAARMGRSRKLSDLYAAAGVPRELRSSSVVAEREDGCILWAEHIGPAFGVNIRVTLTRLDPGVNSDTLEAKGDTT